MKKTPIALLAALLAAAPAGAGQYNIYLTAEARSDVPVNAPANRFACREKIYGVVEINRPEGGNSRHTLYATWENPSGEDQETTEYPFQLLDGSARVWVWLKLHRSSESAFTQFMNPSGGLEEFAGEWQLHIRIDNKQVGSRTFQMLC